MSDPKTILLYATKETAALYAQLLEQLDRYSPVCADHRVPVTVVDPGASVDHPDRTGPTARIVGWCIGIGELAGAPALIVEPATQGFVPERPADFVRLTPELAKLVEPGPASKTPTYLGEDGTERVGFEPSWAPLPGSKRCGKCWSLFLGDVCPCRARRDNAMNLKGLSIEERGYLAVLDRLTPTPKAGHVVRLKLAPGLMGSTIRERFARNERGDVTPEYSQLQRCARDAVVHRNRGPWKRLQQRVEILRHLIAGDEVIICDLTLKEAETEALAVLDLFEECFEIE